MLHKKKGGTVVPPSDFQDVTTKGKENQRVTAKFPRPHGRKRTHGRKKGKLFYMILHRVLLNFLLLILYISASGFSFFGIGPVCCPRWGQGVGAVLPFPIGAPSPYPCHRPHPHLVITTKRIDL